MRSVSPATRRVADNQAMPYRTTDLVSVYNRFFYFEQARTPDMIRIAREIRYQVYCEETGYLPTAGLTDRQEADDHDTHSVSSLLFHRPSGRPVGTVRLVLPRSDQPGCAQPARLAAQSLDTLDDTVLPRRSTGEISRFAIATEFRRSVGERLYGGLRAQDAVDPRQVIPHITLGLMASVFEMALDNGISHLCAIIDPPLLRMTGKLGLGFTTVGPAVDFHGDRLPVYGSLAGLAEGLIRERPQIWQVISDRGRLQPDGVRSVSRTESPAASRTAG